LEASKLKLNNTSTNKNFRSGSVDFDSVFDTESIDGENDDSNDGGLFGRGRSDSRSHNHSHSHSKHSHSASTALMSSSNFKVNMSNHQNNNNNVSSSFPAAMMMTAAKPNHHSHNIRGNQNNQSSSIGIADCSGSGAGTGTGVRGIHSTAPPVALTLTKSQLSECLLDGRCELRLGDLGHACKFDELNWTEGETR
jgi:hypothetical protein